MKRRDGIREEDRESITARFGVQPTVLQWRSCFDYYRSSYIMEGKHDSRLGGSTVSWLWSEEGQCFIPMDTETLHSDMGRAEVAAHKQIDKWRKARVDAGPARNE